ncbi:hypothetical protein F4860DRAFT_475100 [Xylaria cubensis]|nr:hypothetical protein F4860DRAFT_475100 [Xylaria cubensis]
MRPPTTIFAYPSNSNNTVLRDISPYDRFAPSIQLSSLHSVSSDMKNALLGLASRAWAGRSSVIAQQAPSLSFTYVSVLPMVGSTSQHIRPIRRSLLSLLPRIEPGLRPLHQDATPSRVEISAIEGERKIIFDHGSIPNWLDNMLGGTMNIQPYDFQVWQLRIKDSASYNTPDNASDTRCILPPGNFSYLRSIIHSHVQLRSNSAFVLFFSVTLTYGLIIAIGLLRDWTGLLSLTLIGVSASLRSYAHLNRVESPQLPTSRDELRPTYIVLSTIKGALVVIRTTRHINNLIWRNDEDRVLFTEYPLPLFLHFISWFPYAFGLVLLANSTPETQVAFATVYAAIASLSLLPPTYPTPLELEIYREFIQGCEDATKYKQELRGIEASPSSMRSLWYAIYVTKSINWVTEKHFQQLYDDAWLKEAYKNVENINWPAIHEYERIKRGGDLQASAMVYGTRTSSENQEENGPTEPGDQGNDRITPVPIENW